MSRKSTPAAPRATKAPGRPGRAAAPPPSLRLERSRQPDAFGSNEEFVALLGRYPDHVVAERAGVSVETVGEERRLRGIDAVPYRPRRIHWTPEMIAALGTASDADVGAALGLSKYAVRSKRQVLNIPPHNPRPYPAVEGHRWTPGELALLGKVPDAEVAETVGLHFSTVNKKRRQLGIPAFKPTPPRFDWTEERVALLGAAPDGEIAKALGISAATLRKERRRRGIPAYTETRPIVATHELIELVRRLPNCEVKARTGLRDTTITRLRRKLGIEAPSLSAWRWAAAIPRLGREPDDRIAADVGLSASTVAAKRSQIGIPHPQPTFRRWKDEEVALLGTAPDPVIARRLGRSPGTVYQKRRRLGIPRFRASADPVRSAARGPAPARAGRRRWEAEEIALLGTAPDKVIARRLRRSKDSVYRKREELGIPRFTLRWRAEPEGGLGARRRRPK